MHLTIEIDYEELVETARRPQPFRARLRDVVVLKLPEVSSSEFRLTHRGASDPSGQVQLLVREGTPRVRVHPRFHCVFKSRRRSRFGVSP